MSDLNRNGGIGLMGAVFLVFLVLRLTDHIDWAWYWITAPLWAPTGTVLALLAPVLLSLLISDVVVARRRRKRRAAASKPITGKP